MPTYVYAVRCFALLDHSLDVRSYGNYVGVKSNSIIVYTYGRFPAHIK